MKLPLVRVAVLFAAASAAFGQDLYLSHWQELHSRQPNELQLNIAAPKNTFYAGEVISLQLAFTSTQPNSFVADSRLYDRVGRMNGVEEFIVDPAANSEDPLRGLQGAGGGMGGLSGGPVPLSDKPFAFERILNEWVRFRTPGVWRVYVLSRRVGKPGGGSRVELVSNILTLHVQPAPAAWVRQQIAAAVEVLDAPAELNDESSKRRLAAARVLRFLNSPQAAQELARRMNAGSDLEYYATQGVLSSPYRAQILPALEERLTAPDQAVSAQYLTTMAKLQPSNQYTDRLVASLPRKLPQPRAESMLALLDLAQRNESATPWLPGVVASLIADFSKLPPRTQSNLLEARWQFFQGPAMIPALRELYTHPGLGDISVRRLYELVPAEARAIILAEIRGPEKYLDHGTLLLLPDRNLPELNDALASRLESGQYSDRLILRYATGDIVQRVEQAYRKRQLELDRQNLPHCSSPLVFYFLKYDPEFGERELRQDLSVPSGYPACYNIGFQFRDLGSYAMSLALERLAIEYLSSPAVPVKQGAAEVLGSYGSAAAQSPLWETMSYFHAWWKDREPELQQSQENMQFERTLRIALGQADAWALGETELNRLLTLCSSDWCRQEINEWLRNAKSPIQIRVSPGNEQPSLNLAQYTLHSSDQLRNKLSQYPPETVFHVVSSATDARENAEQAVRDTGHRVDP